MVKKIAGYIRSIPGGAPELNIPVTIRDENTLAQIPVGGMAMGSANPINTNASTGYFEWTCELSPGPILVEAQVGSGQWKRRSGKELMQAGDIFVSNQGDILKPFSTGVMKGITTEFLTTNSSLNLTVQPGMSVMAGRIFETLTNRVIAVPPNGTLAVRNDLLVMRQYVGGTSVGKQEIVLVGGTVNGVDPTINGDPNILEVVLYRSALANGGSTPTLTDLRTYTTIYLGANSVTAAMLTSGGQLSTAEIAKVLKAPTSGNTPAYGTLDIGELNNVSASAPSSGDHMYWNGSAWTPRATSHANLTGVDTDSGLSAIHHTLGSGANQAAPGDHSHGAALITSTADTASIDLTVSGGQLTAAAIFGATATTVAAGNHNHSGVYATTSHNHDASYSALGHNHDSVYSQLAHTHGSYSLTSHNHDASYSTLGHTHNYSSTSHAHGGNQSRIDRATKSYSSTNAVSDTQLLSNTVFLSSGVTYDIVIMGFAQGHMGSGQAGNAQLGVRWKTDATSWGMSVGTELGERPLVASDVVNGVVGTGANETYTLRGRSTDVGTANFLAGHIIAIAIPRESGGAS